MATGTKTVFGAEAEILAVGGGDQVPVRPAEEQEEPVGGMAPQLGPQLFAERLGVQPKADGELLVARWRSR